MKKSVNKKVVNVLSEIYWAEIGAVGIYMDQHSKCSSMGYDKLAEMLEKDAVDEMKHAEILSKRILFIGGTVLNKKHALPIEKQTEIVDMIKMNMDIELDAIERLNKSITTCSSEGDHGSRLLLEEILKSEEDHLDKLEDIFEHIKKFGDQYITTHLI